MRRATLCLQFPPPDPLEPCEIIRYAYYMAASDQESTALIVRAVLSLGRRLRAERPQGSAPLSAIAILSTLNRLGPMPAARLATEERLQPQSLTRIILALERQGWIARARSGADRREITIALTKRGAGLLADDMQARRLWLGRADGPGRPGRSRADRFAAPPPTR